MSHDRSTGPARADSGRRAPIPLAVLTLVVWACSGVEGPGAFVEVERIEGDRWRATYHLEAPARSLAFERPAEFYREQAWEVVTAGYALERSDGWQTLELARGATPQRLIVFELDEFTENIPKEYELFQPFSDGAVALYSGHFYAVPVGPAASDTAVPIRTIRLTPREGARAIVRGRVHEGRFTWTDPIGDGTYIYLGTLDPIETSDLIAVVDPGMPEWLADGLHDYLPRLFATYTQRFGVALPWKPVVLYGFQDIEGSGYESSGGTLTGLIQMTLTGSAWRRPSVAAEEHVFQFVAHEAVHLWNGELVESPGGGGSWMHEGAANAMARDVSLEFGVIDGERHRAQRASAINDCFLALAFGEGPIARAHERGVFRVFYDCGELMAVWTEAAVRQARPDDDIFTFWRDLVRAARAGDGEYDEELYFDVLGEAGVAEGVIAAMRAFLSRPEPIEIAVRGLREVGVYLEPADTPDPAFQRELVRRAFASLMGGACEGRMSFRSGDPVITYPLTGCEPFTREMEVHRVAGHRVGDEGAALYDAVAAACAARGRVTLHGQDGTVIGSVPCETEVPRRPPWYELRGS